ncbi:MAG: protein translocase subunit SecD [Candidatus Limnocylindrales bacterium]
MRRITPILIVVVGLLALAVDFSFALAPGFVNPITGNKIETRLGLDLQGGVEVDYLVLPANGRTPDSAALNTIVGIIDQRVNATGTTEPVIETKGSNQISVQLPGVSDVQQVVSIVGSTGQLTFVPLPPSVYGTSTAAGTKPVPADGDTIDPSLKPLFGGDQVASANATFDSTTNQRAVAFTLKDPAKTIFAQWSSSHIGDFFAIVLDGKVVSAPYIKSAITDGSGQISGSFTAAQMNDLVTVLQYGALPFPLQEISSQNVPATLGATFLHRTLLGGLLGILMVFIFMLLYYRLPGSVAVLALLYYAVVVLAIFRAIPVTLTLAGIAAFVLSVGMAVDANILIFERTREELRAGKTLAPAIEAGFNRAWNSIFDSNVSSLITAFILFWFGSSVIRGFALVLMIGVLTSMFTAVTLSRTVLRTVVRWQWTRKASLFGVNEEEFVTAAPRGVRRSDIGSRA